MTCRPERHLRGGSCSTTPPLIGRGRDSLVLRLHKISIFIFNIDVEVGRGSRNVIVGERMKKMIDSENSLRDPRSHCSYI